MKSLLKLACLTLCLLPLGCRSSGAEDDVPCTCGQPLTDMEGCAHRACMDGHRMSDNPDCVCGTLTIPK